MNCRKPKNHHFISQFILKNFSSGKKKKLWFFDKHEEKSFNAPVRKLASENKFYEFATQDFGIDLEKKLAQLESICAPIFKKIIIEQNMKNISSQEHAHLCLFCSVQKLRTNSSRVQLKQFNDLMTNFITNKGHSINDVENFRWLSEKEVKDASLLNIRKFGSEIAEHFLDKELIVQKAPKGHEFLISDNPIALHNNFPRPGRGNLGLKLKGIEIHFPISPKLCLMFMCSETVKEFREKIYQERARRSLGVGYPVDIREAEKVVDIFDSGETSTLKPENVEFHNSLQVINASRFIYSSKNKFDLVIDMLKTNPEIKHQPEIVAH